jgi:hypothetical protein
MESPDSLMQSAILAEYSALREELGGYLQRQDQIANVVVPIVAAVLFYAYQSRAAVAFLGVIVILASSFWFFADTSYKIKRLSSYIAGVIEPRVPGLQWQTLFDRTLRRRNPLVKFELSFFVILGWMISLLCLPAAWYVLPDHLLSTLLLHGALALGALAILLASSIRNAYVSSSKRYDQWVATWREQAAKLPRDVPVPSRSV